MAIACDFSVKFNPDLREQTLDILHDALLGRRVHRNKPTIWVHTGGSGEGKSISLLKLAEGLYKRAGIDLLKYLNYVEIFTPFEYAQKMRALLDPKNKTTKPLNIVIIDEGREVVDATQWMTFLNRAISHINAISRGIKPLLIVIITQSLFDIDGKIRRTMNFFSECDRQDYTKMRIYRTRVNNFDIDNPKFQKYPLKGYITKDGVRRRVRLSMVEFSLPRKELRDKYEEMQRTAKLSIARRLLDRMDKEFNSQLGRTFAKVDNAVSWYSADPERLKLILKTTRGKLSFLDDFKKAHDFSPSETKEFKVRLLNQLEKMGVSYGSAKAEA